MKNGTRVLCIDTSNPKRPDRLKPEHYVVEGEVYTICGTYFDARDGHHYYYLEERMHIQPIASYRAYRFIPIDDNEVEEEAVSANRVEELVCSS